MRKTKIICTLGPSTDKGDVLRDLIANGMNVARFNFSHGSYEEHGGRLAKLKALREELGKPVAALLRWRAPRRSAPSLTRICPRTCSPAAPSCWMTA